MNDPTQSPLERHELHNPSVDESVAAGGACAQVHLATGRVCILEHSHKGSCDFTPAADAHSLTSSDPMPGQTPGPQRS